MFNTVANHLVKQAGRDGMQVLTNHGAWGLGIGTVYGAISDSETVMGGAFRGGIVGAGAGVGAKYFGARYVQGMNNLAAHIGAPVHRSAEDWGNVFNQGSFSDRKAFDTLQDQIIRGRAASAMHGYNGSAFDFAGDVDNWFKGKFELDGNVSALRESGVHFNKAKTAFFANKDQNLEQRQDVMRSFFGSAPKGDYSNVVGVNDSGQGIKTFYNSHITDQAKRDEFTLSQFLSEHQTLSNQMYNNMFKNPNKM